MLSIQRRFHTCGLPDESQTVQCNTQPGRFSEWSVWSGCTATCGGGTRSRVRTHNCGLPNENESEVGNV